VCVSTDVLAGLFVLLQVIDDPAGSKLLLVMEYMEGGPVLTREALEKRERLPESLARQYFRDMVKALDYLHCHKVPGGGGGHSEASLTMEVHGMLQLWRWGPSGRAWGIGRPSC
jgi:serine/threonine protein kinase